MIKNLFVVALCSVMVGCQGQIEESDLVGKWSVVGFSAETPNLSPAIIEGGKAEALSSVYELKEDGTSVLISDYYINGSRGKWSYEGEKKLIRISHSDDNDSGDEIYMVKSVGDSKMVWMQEIPGVGTLTMTLTNQP